MKTTFRLFFMAAIVCLVASCAKNPAKLLMKKDGTWTATAITTIPGFGTFTDISEITFNDGTGTTKDLSTGDITSFTWEYDKKNETITMTQTDGTDVYVTVHKVSEVKKDSETWTFANGTENGVIITTSDFTQTITLVRK